MLDRELNSLFPGKPLALPALKVSYKRTIDDMTIDALIRAIETRIKNMNQIGLDNVLVGLSGGVDSAITAALLHKSNVYASAIIIELDSEDGFSEDTTESIELANKIGIEYQVVNATKLYTEHLKLIEKNNTITRVHLRSRLINNIVFQFADNQSALVADTTDKSEEILKIYEESFRGHIAPLINLYKSELYDVADYFSLQELRAKSSGCPELIDFDAFGADWDTLDPILYLITDEKLGADEIAQKYSLDSLWLKKLQHRIDTQPLRTTSFNVQF